MRKIASRMRTGYRKISSHLSSSQIILLTFAGVIFCGSLLLFLPISHSGQVPITYLDALFTATSAVCVTGLVTVTTAFAWSTFGKIVIMLLIQIGGLSLITIFFFFISRTSRKVSLRDRMAIQATVNTSGLSGTIKAVLWVIRVTVIIEAIGAILLFFFFFFHEGIEWHTAAFYGVFHSVSAFCNAGFDIIAEDSLISFSSSFYLYIVIMSLIISGGLGFSVWGNIIAKIKAYRSPLIKHKVRLTLQTKMVIIFTLILLIGGSMVFLALEYTNPNTIGNFNLPHKILATTFQATTLRTAGFAGINQGMLREPSKLVSIMLMIIGGSPGGTAGGMKTTTVLIIILSIISITKNKEEIVMGDRTITTDLVKKAMAVVVLMLALLLGTTLILSVTEFDNGFEIIDLMYEAASALATVGNTCGITPYMTKLGKVILILCMIVGRTGPVTFMAAITATTTEKSIVRYPTEEIMIG